MRILNECREDEEDDCDSEPDTLILSPTGTKSIVDKFEEDEFEDIDDGNDSNVDDDENIPEW